MCLMKKIKIALISAVISAFSITGCMDPADVVFRANSDYFPLTLLSSWFYVTPSDSDTVSLQVTDYYEIGDDTVFVMDFRGETWELFKQNGNVLRHYRFSIYPAGDELVLENGFRIFLQMPLVDGNSWEDTYADTVTFRGITYNYRHKLKGTVSLQGNLLTPYGEMENVYKVEISEEFRVNDRDSLDTLILFFAPDVGPVTIGEGTEVYKLVDYRRGE